MSEHPSSSPQSLGDILADWDGRDLMEGVRLASQVRNASNLTEWLALTKEVEAFQRHHHISQG